MALSKAQRKKMSDSKKAYWANKRAMAAVAEVFEPGTPVPRGIEVPSFLQKTVHDPVNHPSHYTSMPNGLECIQVTEQLNFNIGNAVKYLWRAGRKDGEDMITALQKARWYIDREIDRIQGS